MEMYVSENGPILVQARMNPEQLEGYKRRRANWWLNKNVHLKVHAQALIGCASVEHIKPENTAKDWPYESLKQMLQSKMMRKFYVLVSLCWRRKDLLTPGELISQHIILPPAFHIILPPDAFLQFTFQHILHPAVFEVDVVREIRLNLCSLNSAQTLFLCFSTQL